MIPISNATVDGTFAPLHFPEYRTTVLRNPSNDLLMVPQRLGELSGPVFGAADLRGEDNDLTEVNGGRGHRAAHHRPRPRHRRGRSPRPRDPH